MGNVIEKDVFQEWFPELTTSVGNIYKNEKIIVNIDSPTAKELQELLNKTYEESVLRVKYNEYGIEEGSSLFLYTIDDTTPYISLTIANVGFIMNSDGFWVSYESFVFDKKDGHRLSDDEILQYFDVDESEAMEILKEYIITKDGVLGEGSGEVCNDINKKCYELNEKNTYGITAEKGLRLNLSARYGMVSGMGETIILSIK